MTGLWSRTPPRKARPPKTSPSPSIGSPWAPSSSIYPNFQHETAGRTSSTPFSLSSPSSSTSSAPAPQGSPYSWNSGSSLSSPGTPRRRQPEVLGPTPSPSSSYRLPPLQRSMGYLAFPPPSASPSPPKSSPPMSAPAPETTPPAPADAQVDLAAEEKARALRLQQAEEARRGEEAWVASGGTLRDAHGRRDPVRTAAVRAELALRAWEAEAVARWEAYEAAWRRLLGGDADEVQEGLRFKDIPWPVSVPGGAVQPEDVTVSRVEEFLLEGLKVRGCPTTRRERVRGALLRWHPDKMTRVVGRVVDEDTERVKEGVRVVTECLQKLNETR
ncbi:hypothetical protein H0H81_006142 [Sphagnurus paluster]|uniref:Uncharacterized protein n=1 Tax=Sphagnurus paluster TaxID=117069 RepID=A0A9P7FRT6_9AGAR|nr:hypothetical protein H0H81_006142 [Sphagnurus paluster]